MARLFGAMPVTGVLPRLIRPPPPRLWCRSTHGYESRRRAVDHRTQFACSTPTESSYRGERAYLNEPL